LEVHELDQEFAEVPLRTFHGPIVYKIYLGSVLMYIGESAFGLARVLAPAHQHAEIIRHEMARLEIMSCNSSREALDAEAALIKFHSPPLNKGRVIGETKLERLHRLQDDRRKRTK